MKIASENKVHPRMLQANSALLDSTDKYLSVYRGLYGRYPDSLKELEKLSFYPYFYDFMVTQPKNPDRLKVSPYFRYRKSGDSSYILYSVGVDYTANTKDDIYSKKSHNP